MRITSDFRNQMGLGSPGVCLLKGERATGCLNTHKRQRKDDFSDHAERVTSDLVLEDHQALQTQSLGSTRGHSERGSPFARHWWEKE